MVGEKGKRWTRLVVSACLVVSEGRLPSAQTLITWLWGIATAICSGAEYKNPSVSFDKHFPPCFIFITSTLGAFSHQLQLHIHSKHSIIQLYLICHKLFRHPCIPWLCAEKQITAWHISVLYFSNFVLCHLLYSLD